MVVTSCWGSARVVPHTVNDGLTGNGGLRGPVVVVVVRIEVVFVASLARGQAAVEAGFFVGCRSLDIVFGGHPYDLSIIRARSTR